MADVAPFRAVRYARPSAAVVAPPYDVVTPAERAVLARDPHNVVHLTLGDSEEEAGRLFRAWLDEGVLVRDERPAVWALEQDYVGPDAVGRTRGGLVASLAVEPYGGDVLPHERTHAGPKESRLRLLRAARAQLEPIFLLYDGEPPLTPPDRPPDLEAEGTRLWRVEDDGSLPAAFAGRQLLIADGHHRYETALAYHEQERTPESGRMLVVLVSTSDPGLEIFPTHRLFTGRPDLGGWSERGGRPDVEDELAKLAGRSYAEPAVVVYTGGLARTLTGEAGLLDVELVDRFGHEGIGYTPDWREAVRRVDGGEADIAFLLRPTRIEDVFERARRGEVLPQKTTYFFPKLLSGLLFHPVEP
jgi:uncharacterized protein (DUF1015 family)